MSPAPTIAVIGLGYVGLPLAVAFAGTHKVIGFDLSQARIDALTRGQDTTGEVPPDTLADAAQLTLTADPGVLSSASIFIVAVPTPVDDAKRPDLSRLLAASRTVGEALARRGRREGETPLVIYESTVFPGCTRSVCVPEVERASGLVADQDFEFGYSPERVNPGDTRHRLADIVKVTAGSTPAAAERVDALYAVIITAGTHKAASVEVAEAAKVIENTQRDLNIALMNELAIIFHRLGLDTHEVLEAARTKWNFLPFTPGLVGGHCIGVDPYYLTFRAQQVGYHPEIVLAGRRINDGMARHVADRVARLMMGRGMPVVGSHILVAGLTFKENCPDLRNSQVVEVVRELSALNAKVSVWDPVADPCAAQAEYGVALTDPTPGAYDGVIIAVAHDAFRTLGAPGMRTFLRPGGILFDVKAIFNKDVTDGRL